MRLLVINPNITESVTDLIRAEAVRSASPGTTLTVLTAPFGVAYIETRFEALTGAWASANLAAEHHPGHDALIVAAFGDPGLCALRELMPIPVVGLTEAALMTACQLGQRFSIVAISRRITAWYRECVQASGLADRLASIRCLEHPLRDIASVQQDDRQALCELVLDCVRDGADVVIVAGAPLAGLAREIAADSPVPLVDGISAAIRQAEALARLGLSKPAAGSFAMPPAKPNRGLPLAIEDLLRRARP
jgi:Asp/Glu/hydantoin racemase